MQSPAQEDEVEQNVLFRSKFNYRGLSPQSVTGANSNDPLYSSTQEGDEETLLSVFNSPPTPSREENNTAEHSAVPQLSSNFDDQQIGDDIEWKVKLSVNSKWGRLGIRGFQHEHHQCESLLRSEEEYLTLKIEDDIFIRKKLQKSRGLRSLHYDTYDQVLQEMDSQQRSIQELLDYSPAVVHQERKLPLHEIHGKISQAEEYNIRFRKTMQQSMREHISEDFLHLGNVIFHSAPSLRPMSTHPSDEEEEFFDVIEEI